MLQQLIERSNQEEFYQNSWFILKNVNFKTGKSNLCEINLFLDDRDFRENTIIKQEWKIMASNSYEINNFRNENLLPFIKLEILKEHPLLWKYKYSTIQCEISELPIDINPFIGELYFELEKITGNWISFQDIIFGIQNFHKGNNRVKISIPKPLKQTFQEVTEKFKMKFIVIEENEISETSTDEIKILFFGNKDVSPNTYNFNQPYVIAKEFTGIATEMG
ncbi:hypothetical protein [Flavobacterium sp. K5-23]|uniref:hypothetical protein n=1 Tax=Flavobacterium sp. K5-23 TaxID=2746225 RepID=UPI00200D3F6E|nr:hypothetical protein [Flavobacterium sp. K5-23]UQD57143.1 hypothetical protein FLAK523_12395 [Flavobacterium sp. K5-23]